MRVVVIGGSSFIGVYTVQALLDAGHKVLATGRNGRFREHYRGLGVDYIRYDLMDRHAAGSLPLEGADAAILLAAALPANSPSDLKADDDSADYVMANAVATGDLLERCRQLGVRRLLSACSYADVQNSWSSKRPISENDPRDFKLVGDHAAYVISKNAANDLMWHYNEQHGMTNVSFRLPPVYGVGPHNSLHVNGERCLSGIARFIAQAKAGEEITVFGDASVARDVVYVKDVASAYVAAIESETANGLYNVGSGVATSLLEQAEAIADVFQGPPGRARVNVNPAKENGLSGYSMDISRAESDFGYRPRFADFREMMQDWKREEESGIYLALFGRGR